MHINRLCNGHILPHDPLAYGDDLDAIDGNFVLALHHDAAIAVWQIQQSMNLLYELGKLGFEGHAGLDLYDLCSVRQVDEVDLFAGRVTVEVHLGGSAGVVVTLYRLGNDIVLEDGTAILAGPQLFQCANA